MDTFGGHRQLSALDDLDGLLGPVTRLGLDVLDLVDDIVALKDLAEDDVATIEPAVLQGSKSVVVPSTGR